MPQQPYIPTLGELTQGGNPMLGTVSPGVTYTPNEGINLLFQAATRNAYYNWQKKQDIEKRKEDVFKNLRDLSAIEYMPEDRKELTDQLKKVLGMVSPSVFNGSDDAARLRFEQETIKLSSAINQSKQDKLNHEFDKKTFVENPEFQNNPNQRKLSAYPKLKLGERTYDGLIPTPELDLGVIGKAAAVDVFIPNEDSQVIGNYTTDKNGNQVFTPNPNGKWIERSAGGGTIDNGKYDKNWSFLVSDPVGSRKIRYALDYQFQEELTPEQRKQFSTDGGKTPDYEKMLEVSKEQYRPKAAAAAKKYDKNDFELQKMKDANAMKRVQTQERGKNSRANPKGPNENMGNDFESIKPFKNIGGLSLSNGIVTRNDGTKFTGEIRIDKGYIPKTIDSAIEALDSNDSVGIDLDTKKITAEVKDGEIISIKTQKGLMFTKDNQMVGQRKVDVSRKDEGPAPFGNGGNSQENDNEEETPQTQKPPAKRKITLPDGTPTNKLING